MPLLRDAPKGRIVNVASTAALRGAPYIAAYAASKHALLGFSRVLALKSQGWADPRLWRDPRFKDVPWQLERIQQQLDWMQEH